MPTAIYPFAWSISPASLWGRGRRWQGPSAGTTLSTFSGSFPFGLGLGLIVCRMRCSDTLQNRSRRRCWNASTQFSQNRPPPQPTGWGGLIRFLFKKGDLLDTAGDRPVCLQDCTYKLLSGILTDRLYRLAERYGLLDPSQEGFRRLHSTQRQVQSLHWAFEQAANQRQPLFVVYLDFANAFNSVDHEALW